MREAQAGRGGWSQRSLSAWRRGPAFRNVLAPLYASVDYDRAYDALSEVSDLERFAALASAKLDA